MKFLISILFTFIFSSGLFAQHKRCGFDLLMQQKENKQKVEAYQEELKLFIKNDQFLKSDTVIRIPIVFHIIHRLPVENISTNQVLSQLDVLNKDFRKLNSDVSNASGFSAADVKIEFCLATEAPDGSAADGIVRKSTTIDNIGTTEEYYKAAPIWDRERYLNVWVCDNNASVNGFIGEATPPSISNKDNEGIIVDFIAFGTEGTAEAPQDLGRTVTHEIAHMFDLYHIWGTNEFCSSSDFVDDTPTQDEPVYDCPSSRTSCGSKDNLSNFMGYIDDRCMGNFTEGQKTRMRAAIEMTRPGLMTDNECLPVGIKEQNLFKEVKVYPNPSNGIVEISIPKKLNLKAADILVFDILNKEQKIKTKPTPKGYQIELNNKRTGIYILRIRTENNQLSKKLIVN